VIVVIDDKQQNGNRPVAAAAAAAAAANVTMMTVIIATRIKSIPTFDVNADDRISAICSLFTHICVIVFTARQL